MLQNAKRQNVSGLYGQSAKPARPMPGEPSSYNLASGRKQQFGQEILINEYKKTRRLTNNQISPPKLMQ